MTQKISLWMLSALLGLGLIAQSCSYFKRTQIEPIYEEEEVVNASEDCDSECPFFMPEQFEAGLSNLFEMQGNLLNDVMVAVLNDQEFAEIGESNLYENTHEIAALMGTVYGSRVADQIEFLLGRQNQLFLAYLDAIKCQNDALAKRLLVQSYANGHLFVELINIMNPFFAYAPEKYMMDEHVTLQSDQAKAYFKGDIERGEELKRRSIKQSQEMGLHIARAVQTQMTEPF